MKKPTGRRPNFSPDVMRIIAEKCAVGELSHREAARIYRISHGAVSQSKLDYHCKTNHTFRAPEIVLDLPPPRHQEKTVIESEVRALMRELRSFDQEIQKLEKFRK